MDNATAYYLDAFQSTFPGCPRMKSRGLRFAWPVLMQSLMARHQNNSVARLRAFFAFFKGGACVELLQKHIINSHANPGRHCMLTVRVEVDRAVRDVASAARTDSQRKIVSVHKGH